MKLIVLIAITACLTTCGQADTANMPSSSKTNDDVANSGPNSVSNQLLNLMMEVQALRGLMKEQMTMLKLQNQQCCQKTQEAMLNLFQQTTPHVTKATTTMATDKPTSKMTTTTTTTAPDCSGFEVRFGGSCYTLFGTGQQAQEMQKGWAKYSCQSRNAELVGIETVAESRFLNSYIWTKNLPTDAHIFTSGVWDRALRRYEWESTGQPFSFTDWGPNGKYVHTNDSKFFTLAGYQGLSSLKITLHV